MVHVVRYSVWVALGWISLYLLLWALLSFLALGVVMGVVQAVAPPVAAALQEPSAWWLAPAALVAAGWVRHSRRYWRQLLDRSPQIELHPTFLRAAQLDDDILWKEVASVGGSQVGIGSDEVSLDLSLTGGRVVRLNLVGMNMGLRRLYGLVCGACEADNERRQVGRSFDPANDSAMPPEPVRTHGYGAAELGEEAARFGAVGFTGRIVFGVVVPAALFAFGIALELSDGRDVPGAGSVAVGVTGAAVGLPVLLFGLAIARVRLVLRQHGLTYRGTLRTFMVRYGDILRVSGVSIRRAGEAASRLVAVELTLRDGRVIKLSHLKDAAAVSRRIEELRSAAAREARRGGRTRRPLDGVEVVP